MVTGDYTGTFDAATYGGLWADLFGDGWKALWAKGGGASGIEDVGIDITGGNGVFTEFGASPARAHTPASWAKVKNLYR